MRPFLGCWLATMLERPEQTLNIVMLLVLVTQLTSATLLGVLLEGSAGALGVVIGIVLQIFLFFVVVLGVASLVLFVLVRKVVSMMHGVN